MGGDLKLAGTHVKQSVLTRRIEFGAVEAFFLRADDLQSTMRDACGRSTGDPQIAHNLSCLTFLQPVDKLWMNFALWHCNEQSGGRLRMDARGFLPTMKLQLSQLP
jgi:hypothetical protein